MLNGVLQKLGSLASVLQLPVPRAERRRSSAILEIQNVHSVRSICGCADLPRRKHFSEYFYNNGVLPALNHGLNVKERFFLNYSLEPRLVSHIFFISFFNRTDVRRRYRDQHISPESPSYDDQARITLRNPRNDRLPSLAGKFNIKDSPEADVRNGTTANGGGTGEEQSTSNVRSVLKRRRPNSAQITTYKQNDTKSMPPDSERPISSGQAAPEPWEAVSGYANVHSFSWVANPYQVDPGVTMHYMETYFIHINAATYRIFPRKHFLHWVKSHTAKSPNDLMLIYTMLAMGSIFSSRNERNHEGSLFSKIARYAVEKNHGNYSLQLVQSRLLLAFYHFSTGDTHKAWDYGGMGFRVASGLKLNLEQGATDIIEDEILEYGLNRHALAECRRRTFWSAYMMDVSVLPESNDSWHTLTIHPAL